MSDNEFKPTPLTAKEKLRLNLLVTGAVAVVMLIGVVIFHYHVDPTATADTPASPELTVPKG